MNRDLNNIDDIRSYLLGSASAEDAERMGELSVTDIDFIDQLDVTEKELIDSYVSKTLEGGELRQFEEYYLSSTTRAEKVRFARAFKEFSEREIKSTSKAGNATPTGRLAGLMASLLSWGRPGAFRFAGAALVLLIAIAGLWIAFRNGDSMNTGVEVVADIEPIRGVPAADPAQPAPIPPNDGNASRPNRNAGETARSIAPPDRREPVSRPQPRPVIVTFVLAPPLRGNTIPAVSIPAHAELAAVRLELESQDFPFYTVSLKQAADNVVRWQSSRIRASKGGAAPVLRIVIPARKLKSSVYRLTLSGVAADGSSEIVGDYPFRVVR